MFGKPLAESNRILFAIRPARADQPGEVCSTIELEGRCLRIVEIKTLLIPLNVAGVVGFEPTK